MKRMGGKDPFKMRWHDWLILVAFLFVCFLSWTDLSVWIESLWQ